MMGVCLFLSLQVSKITDQNFLKKIQFASFFEKDREDPKSWMDCYVSVVTLLVPKRLENSAIWHGNKNLAAKIG